MVKGNFIVFLYLYWIILGILIFSFGRVFGFKKYQKSSVTRKIEDIDKGEDNLRRLMQEAQINYFTGKIGAEEYETQSGRHQKELARIRKSRIGLRNKRIKMLTPRQVAKDLDLEKEQVEKEAKKLKGDYYRHHRISEKDYKSQFGILNERLAEIEDERIMISLMEDKAKGKLKDKVKKGLIKGNEGAKKNISSERLRVREVSRSENIVKGIGRGFRSVGVGVKRVGRLFSFVARELKESFSDGVKKIKRSDKKGMMMIDNEVVEMLKKEVEGKDYSGKWIKLNLKDFFEEDK